ncbi:MAG: hypothetical protein ACOVOQ_12715 [Flavobacterium sp.]
MNKLFYRKASQPNRITFWNIRKLRNSTELLSGTSESFATQ